MNEIAANQALVTIEVRHPFNLTSTPPYLKYGLCAIDEHHFRSCPLSYANHVNSLAWLLYFHMPGSDPISVFNYVIWINMLPGWMEGRTCYGRFLKLIIVLMISWYLLHPLHSRRSINAPEDDKTLEDFEIHWEYTLTYSFRNKKQNGASGKNSKWDSPKWKRRYIWHGNSASPGYWREEAFCSSWGWRGFKATWYVQSVKRLLIRDYKLIKIYRNRQGEHCT